MKDQSHLIDDLDKAKTQRLALNLEIVFVKSKVKVTQILWPRANKNPIIDSCLLPRSPGEQLCSLVLSALCLLSALKQ